MTTLDERRHAKLTEMARRIHSNFPLDPYGPSRVIAEELAGALVRLEDAEARIANLEASGAKTLVVVSKLLARMQALEAVCGEPPEEPRFPPAPFPDLWWGDEVMIKFGKPGDDDGECGEVEEVERSETK